MDKGVKIGIAIGSGLLLVGGAIFAYRKFVKGNESKTSDEGELNKEKLSELPSDIKPTDNIGGFLGSLPIPSGVQQAAQDAATNIINQVTAPSTATTVEPSAEEYIRMADRYVDWNNMWNFASKLGITDKDKVGGTSAAADKGIISTASRKAFGDIVAKYPNWKELVLKKLKALDIPTCSSSPEACFNASQKGIKDTYGFEMAQFSGASGSGWNKGIY